MTKVLRGVMAVLGATAFLAVSAATAFAGDGYATGGGGVAGESTGGGGTLPFTGAELALYVVIGLAIVASGLALRAYSSRRHSCRRLAIVRGRRTMAASRRTRDGLPRVARPHGSADAQRKP